MCTGFFVAIRCHLKTLEYKNFFHAEIRIKSNFERFWGFAVQNNTWKNLQCRVLYKKNKCSIKLNAWDQLEYSAVGDTGSVSYGKPASLAARSTAMATFAREWQFPFFSMRWTLLFIFIGGEFCCKRSHFIARTVRRVCTCHIFLQETMMHRYYRV